MKEQLEKIRLIYLPFLTITACFVITYTFLHWLFFIKTNLISLKEDIVNFWLPFGLPWIPILIWLRPRIKLLKFKNDNSSFFFQLLAALIIAIPTIIAQEYLVTASGKMTSLEKISQIEKSEKTKYYTLKEIYIDKKNIGIVKTASVTGKHNEDFNMLIYITMPILETVEDTSKFECEYWLGKRYDKRISNRLSEEEKNREYKKFSKSVEQEFAETDFNKFTYLEMQGNTDDLDSYIDAIDENTFFDFKNPTVFEAKNEPFQNRNGDKLTWIFRSLGIGLLVWLIFLLFSKLDEVNLKKFKSGKVLKNNDLKEFFDFFIPKEGFYITPILININCLVFLIMVLSGFGFISFKGNDLLNWGANFRPYTIDGQWWRLLTNTFLHGGLMHLLANMYGLLFVGIFLEPVLGKTKYLVIYLTTGILASIASLWWYDATVSVGASGAIFGLYGFFMALLLLKVFPADFSKTFLISTSIFIGFNLLMGLTGGIDNAAHIGGLLSGFIIGIVLSGQLKEQLTELNEK